MKITVQTFGSGITKAIAQHASKAIQELGKIHSNVSEADIRLKTGSTDASDASVCEVYLKTPAKNIFAIERAGSFETSVKRAAQKLKGQLERLEASTPSPE
jgi:ribosomal subunit interface protein